MLVFQPSTCGPRLEMGTFCVAICPMFSSYQLCEKLRKVSTGSLRYTGPVHSRKHPDPNCNKRTEKISPLRYSKALLKWEFWSKKGLAWKWLNSWPRIALFVKNGLQPFVSENSERGLHFMCRCWRHLTCGFNKWRHPKLYFYRMTSFVCTFTASAVKFNARSFLNSYLPHCDSDTFFNR